MFQQRTLFHIPQSFRIGWLLQKQLMVQEITIVFNQIVKQNLSYIPCQLMRYLFLKNLHTSKGLFVDIECLKIGLYVAAVYEGQWYPSLILEINWDQWDLLVKSMHNCGYDKNCFFWPPRDAVNYVPFAPIIGLTEVQNIVGRHGRNNYKISAKFFEIFKQNLSKLLNRKQ